MAALFFSKPIFVSLPNPKPEEGWLMFLELGLPGSKFAGLMFYGLMVSMLSEMLCLQAKINTKLDFHFSSRHQPEQQI